MTVPPRRGAEPIVYRVLRLSLLGLLVVICAKRAIEILFDHPIGVDLEIPLRAATRWLDGGQPYLASAFEVPVGRELPFLYPPYVLPMLAPLTAVPTGLLIAVWVSVCAVVVAAALRRFGVAWPIVPLVMGWPPLVEVVLGGNVEVVGFAALAMLYGPAASVDARLRPAIHDAALAGISCLFKVAQPHILLNVARRRPDAGAIAVIGLATVALGTLPLTGLELWFDWVDHASRAGDPTWQTIGSPLSTIAPRTVALVVTAAAVVLALHVRGDRSAGWLGLLIVLGAPSLHLFGFIYLLPGIMSLRRELAFAIAALVAIGITPTLWLAILLLAAAMLGGTRWVWLRAG